MTTDMSDLINKVHCLEFSDMCARLPDKSIDMILCDPPYGTTALKDTWDVPIPFDVMWSAFKRIIKPNGAIVLTASQPFTSALVMSNLKWFRYEWIIDKKHGVNHFQVKHRPVTVHETILIFSPVSTHEYSYHPQGVEKGNRTSKQKPFRESATYSYRKSHKPTYKCDQSNYPKSIISISFADHTDIYHPTQKPVALFEYLIRTYTLEGELVFDPCVGSGTTALASVNTGRNFICSDFTQEYVDIANERLERADPTKPTRLTDTHTQLSLLGLLGE